MGLTWTTLTAQLTTYLEEVGGSDFQSALPQIVGDAELRIYRDLNFLATRGVNRSLTFTKGSRTLDLSGMTGATIGGYPVAYAYPVTVEGLSALTPQGTAPPAAGRVRFQPASLDMIDLLWPDESDTAPPGAPFALWAMLDPETIVVAPTPDQAYAAELTGTWRAAPMSAAEPNSWLGDNCPDLLFSACMVEGLMFQQASGGLSDNPQLGLAWNGRYEERKAQALSEEGRRKLIHAAHGARPMPMPAGPVAGH